MINADEGLPPALKQLQDEIYILNSAIYNTLNKLKTANALSVLHPDDTGLHNVCIAYSQQARQLKTTLDVKLDEYIKLEVSTTNIRDFSLRVQRKTFKSVKL